jgi:hypothetical protein
MAPSTWVLCAARTRTGREKGRRPWTAAGRHGFGGATSRPSGPSMIHGIGYHGVRASQYAPDNICHSTHNGGVLEVVALDEFADWYGDLSDADTAAVYRVVSLLEARSVTLEPPYSSAIRGFGSGAPRAARSVRRPPSPRPLCVRSEAPSGPHPRRRQDRRRPLLRAGGPQGGEAILQIPDCPEHLGCNVT